MKETKYGFGLTNKAGWKSVRARMEKFLPETNEGQWEFVHLEQQLTPLKNFTQKIGKFQMIYDVLSGRIAAQQLINKGATKIIIGTYHNCPWLPQKKGVRYYIFADATMNQLSNLGYNKVKRDISKAARIIYNTGMRKQAEAGHQFLCTSQWYANALIKEHGIKQDQITITPVPVDTKFWKPKGQTKKQGPLQIIFIGADFIRKGGDIIIQVASMPEFSNIKWHLVTKSPPTTKTENISYYTEFNSEANGLKELVQNSDLMVLPTRADCSPNVILEASACGIPTIATQIAGIGEEIEDGITGTLIAEPNTYNLTTALRKYIKTPELIKAHGKAAREKTIKEFDIQVIANLIKKTIAKT